MIGARRPRASVRSAAPVSSSESGSRPRRAAKNASRAAVPSAISPVPKRRGSQKRISCAGVEDEADADVGRVRRRVEQQHARHAQVHEQERVVLELPHEVLAAPREPLHAPPLERVADRAGLERQAPAGVEDVERVSSRPSTTGASWRRIVSTSGSSGIAPSMPSVYAAATGVSTGVAASAMSSCRTCAVSSAPSIQ